MAPNVSIVIPARNDAAALARSLAHLTRIVGIDASEVIVAGAGDREAAEQAIAGRARLVWPRGPTRSELLKAGRPGAHSDLLFFLPAASFPPLGAPLLTQAARPHPP